MIESNYSITENLLNIVREFAPNSTIQISSSNKDWQGREYKSDYITIDEKNHVGFEVFENEIIAFYFSEHHHFEDYSSSPAEDEPDFVDRMRIFLRNLLTCTIRHEKTYKGKVLIKERYIFIHKDKTEECPAGYWIHNLFIRVIPFLSKQSEYRLWKYNDQNGFFIEIS